MGATSESSEVPRHRTGCNPRHKPQWVTTQPLDHLATRAFLFFSSEGHTFLDLAMSISKLCLFVCFQ